MTQKRSCFTWDGFAVCLGVVISVLLLSRTIKVEFNDDLVESDLKQTGSVTFKPHMKETMALRVNNLDESYSELLKDYDKERNNEYGYERRIQEIKDDADVKYFVYQPSGGWGNQRIILQNALAAANAMQRVLVLPPIAPHNFLYYGYNKFNGSDMSSMDLILDLDRLEKAADYGIVVWNSSLADLQNYWSTKSWKLFSKPREVKGVKLTYSQKFITKNWGPSSKNWKYDVVFWNKEGMWLCCAPSMIYAKNISLNKELKLVSKILSKSIDTKYDYNAVHIRRGGGHTGHDRKNARIYFKEHLTNFDRQKPLYIATDETNKKWFLPFMTEYNFSRVLFWEDLNKNELNKAILEDEVKKYPPTMKNDIIGFIEQLVCAQAIQFEGSSKSTFTLAINTIRRNPKQLLELKEAHP